MMTKKRSAEKTVRDIRRATRRHYSAEENIRVVLLASPRPRSTPKDTDALYPFESRELDVDIGVGC